MNSYLTTNMFTFLLQNEKFIEIYNCHPFFTIYFLPLKNQKTFNTLTINY